MRSAAIGFIVCLGVVSLFSDITYEGARSLAGPYLASLGASGAAVGFIAGAGELTGYGLRYISGRITDHLRRYWTILFLGYGMNLAAVPLLAFADTWQLAAALLIMERFGKSIRAPARDALLSHASEHTGRGWGFGLHEAMDQIGALTGPLVVAGVLARRGSYPEAFALLAIPAVCAMLALTVGRTLFPTPADFAPKRRDVSTSGMPRTFWIYAGGAALMAFGFVDFSLMAFHAKRTALLPDAWIPVLYAVAMGSDAIAALVLGRWYDRAGAPALITGACLSLFAAPLVFLNGGSVAMAAAGIVMWGAGMGAQESVLRAAVAGFVPPERRASAYGAFHALYGVAWFLGSALLGLLYGASLWALSVCCVVAQLGGVAIFASVTRRPAQTR
ncbi:MAG: MFS transporter [Bryobacterales bacterium]|nr:MFS transporter [Bryobacterales bacterium]